MFKRLGLLLPLLALTACVVVIGDEDADIRYDDEHQVTRSHSTHTQNTYAISNRIEQALHADPQLMNADLSASNEGSNVTLHGELFHSADLQRAIDIALSDPEVEFVSSRIILTLSK